VRFCFAAMSLVVCTGALACSGPTDVPPDLRSVACTGALTPGGPTDVPPDLGPVPDGSLMTDATGYVARQICAQPGEFQFTVISRFQNRSEAPVYLPRCYPTSTQPMYGIFTGDSATVGSAYAPGWACVGTDNPFEVLPGAVRVDTFLLRGPNSWDGITNQPLGATDGVFRLFLVVSGPRGETVGPGSNAFIVRTSK
jgi:hypothetical protein